MFERKHLQLKHPFTAMVAGPTGSGKTYLVRQMLENINCIFYEMPNMNILWCYGQWQDLYTKPVINCNVTYFDGLPDQAYLEEVKPSLVVVDDLMTELSGDKKMTNLFTKGSHHMNISVLFIVQNLFYNAKEMRTININTNYFILLKNPRDKSQIENLAKQMFPGTKGFLRDAFCEATSKPFGYLLIDCKSDTPDILRVRTRVLPSETIKGEFRPLIYTPK